MLVGVFSSNDHLDDMVNQEIERLKDFIKNRPANLTTGTATMAVSYTHLTLPTTAEV